MKDSSTVIGGSSRRWESRILGLLVLLAAMVGVSLANGPTAGAAGSIWSAPYFVDAYGTLSGISCTSSSFCAGVDDVGGAGVWTGGSNAAGNQFDPGNGFTSVSCVSTSFCMAVDNAGNAIQYNGSTWSAPTNIDSIGSLGSVSCASTSFCLAVDNFDLGNVYFWDGNSWSDTGQATSVPNDSVSCPVLTFCAVVDSFGNAYTENNGTVTSFPNMDPNLAGSDAADPPSTVSCSSPSMCVDVDFQGVAYTFDGTSWSSGSNIDGGTQLTSVSCPVGSSFCMAVDVFGNALTFNGTSWSSPSTADPGHGFTALSCPTSSFCGAEDDAGNFLMYAVPGVAPIVITPVMAAAKLGIAYPATRFHAFGGVAPYHWKKGGSLPKGMKFKNGVLSGTPKSHDRPGVYTFSVQVKDSTPHAHKTTTVRVSLKLDQ